MLYILISLFIFIYFFSNESFEKPAEWLEGCGTIAALWFAYQEILDSKKKFVKEHQSRLRVYVTLRDPLILYNAKAKGMKTISGLSVPDKRLNIVPVNIGLSAGIYRYFGVCKQSDLKRIKELMKKACNGQILEKEVSEIADLISYDVEDVGDSEAEHNITGMNLVYPQCNKLFQTIKSNNVGKIVSKSIGKIEKKLRIQIDKDTLEVLYIDPKMKIYNFEFGPVKKEKSLVTVTFPTKNR